MTVTLTATRDAQIIAAVRAVLSKWLSPALADEATGDVVVALLAPELVSRSMD